MTAAESLPNQNLAELVNTAPVLSVVSDERATDTLVRPFEIVQPTDFESLVHPAIEREVSYLQQAGIDAQLSNIAPTYPLDADTQREVITQSDDLGRLANTAEIIFEEKSHSAGAAWRRLNKRAIALWTLTTIGDPESKTLAPGIDPEIYTTKLFEAGTKSALDMLRSKYSKNPGKAELIYQSYIDLITAPVEDAPHEGDPADSLYRSFVDADPTRRYLSARDFLAGVLDSRAVDTRAQAATQLAFEHVMSHPEHYEGRPLVTASLACGAAGPLFRLDNYFEARGVEVAKNVLVDDDVMALASAQALAESHGVADKVELQKRDLIKTKLTDYIEPHSVDIVDILGIVDYLPTNMRGYKAAANFIGSIRDIMRPGGIIVAGNALASRPQQEFFKAVWPKLEQRDLIDMMGIIKDAGYDTSRTKVRVPAGEGIYGIYGIEVPATDGVRNHHINTFQRAGRAAVRLVY